MNRGDVKVNVAYSNDARSKVLQISWDSSVLSNILYCSFNADLKNVTVIFSTSTVLYSTIVISTSSTAVDQKTKDSTK